jgi:hypothetical protein
MVFRRLLIATATALCSHLAAAPAGAAGFDVELKASADGESLMNWGIKRLPKNHHEARIVILRRMPEEGGRKER